MRGRPGHAAACFLLIAMGACGSRSAPRRGGSSVAPGSSVEPAAGPESVDEQEPAADGEEAPLPGETSETVPAGDPGPVKQAPEPAPNLLANPAFADEDGDGIADGWQLHPEGNGRTTFLSLAAAGDAGSVSIVDRDPAHGVGIRQWLPAEPGHTYAFSVEADAGVSLYLNFHDDRRRLIPPERAIGLPPGGGAFRRRTIREEAPPGTVSVVPWVYSPSSGITEVRVRGPVLVDEGLGAKRAGPLTTDAEFFAALDLDFPGLEEVKRAVGRGDLAAAASAYREFRRTKSRARWRIEYRPDKRAADTVYPSPMPTEPSGTEHALAHLAMRHEFAMPWGPDRKAYFVGEDIAWDFNPRSAGDEAFTKEWTFTAMNRMYQWIHLGEAYWQTLDEKYAREWVAQMTDWVEDNPVPYEVGPGDTLTWRTIESGIRMFGSWPYVYFHFLPSEAFTPEAHLTYVKSAREHALRILAVHREYPKHGGNWVTMECNGVGTVGCLFPELREARAFVDAAFERLAREMTVQVYPDGGQVELTTGYHQVARGNFASLARTATLNRISVEARYMDTLRSMYVWNQRLMAPDGVLPPVNDTDPVTRAPDTLKEAHEIWGGEEFLFGATLGKEGSAPPASGLLPCSGYAAMRSGWKYDDTYLFFDAGPVGTGHWHEDMLGVYMRAWHRALLVEAGSYSYDQSRRRSYVLGTRAHSTVSVDGKDQRRGREGATAVMEPAGVTWSTSPLYDHAAGTYDAGYQQARYLARAYFPLEYVGERDASVSHTRHVFFIKPTATIVVDLMRGSGSHRYDAYFHLNAPAAEVDSRSKAAHTKRTDRVQLGLYPFDPERVRAEVVRGREEPMLGWRTVDEYPMKWEPIPTVVYTREGPAPVAFATMLLPYWGSVPAASVETLDSPEGVWHGRAAIPGGNVEIVVRCGEERALLEGPSGVRADATALITRKLDNPTATWYGLDGAERFESGVFAFETDAPASVTFGLDGEDWCFYNAGAVDARLALRRPFEKDVAISPGEWTRMGPKGDIVGSARPPSLPR